MCGICEAMDRRPALLSLSTNHLSATVEDLSARPMLDPRERECLRLARTELRARSASLN